MGDETRLLIAGCIILVFIVNLFMIISILFPATVDQNASFQQQAPAHSLQDDTTTETAVIPSPTPLKAPAQIVISATPSPDLAASRPSSYVTIEPKEITTPEQSRDLSTSTFQRDFSNYVTIYSMNMKEMTQNLPYVSYSLATPPLIIDYNVIPFNITHIKEIEYKIIATKYDVNLSVNRPYENAWFKVIVRDKATGQVVAEDGYGKAYGLQTPRQLILYRGGNYQFEFTGQYVYVDMSMKVRKEGNIQ